MFEGVRFRTGHRTEVAATRVAHLVETVAVLRDVFQSDRVATPDSWVDDLAQQSTVLGQEGIDHLI